MPLLAASEVSRAGEAEIDRKTTRTFISLGVVLGVAFLALAFCSCGRKRSFSLRPTDDSAFRAKDRNFAELMADADLDSSTELEFVECFVLFGRLGELDLGRCGSLSEKTVERLFKWLDKDQSGKLSFAELELLDDVVILDKLWAEADSDFDLVIMRSLIVM